MSQHRWPIVFVSLVLLLAADCPGTDFIDSGNSNVHFEIVTVGTGSETEAPYDCIQWAFGDLRLRPLDGTCATDSVNSGAPCFSSSDCEPLDKMSTCVGSEANELLGNDGIEVLAAPQPGNILGGNCSPTVTAGGVCESLFCLPGTPGAGANNPNPPPTLVNSICLGGSTTFQVRCPETECRFCQNSDGLGNPVPCATDADCVGPTDACVQQAPCVNESQILGAALIPPQSLILSAGLYEISTLSVSRAMRYVDVPNPPLSPAGPFFAGCFGGGPVVDAFGDTLRFRVLPDQDKLVRFTVDLDELDQNLPAQESCTDFLQNITSILDCETCEPAP